MSIYGTAGQGTYSVSFVSIDAMLAALADNNSNAIHAQQVRNAAWTLWNIGSSQSIPATSIIYNSATPSTVEVGGIPVGTIFPAITGQQLFDEMFHPYVAPVINYFTMNYGGSGTFSKIIYREYGAATSSFYVNYSITDGSNALVPMPNSIQVYGSPTIQHNGVAGIWYTGTLATQSGVISIPSNINNIMTLFASDGVTTLTSTVSIVYENKVYWGASSSLAFNSVSILALNGAGVGIGSTLSSTRTQTLNGINGGGGYIIMAMPSSFGTPSFVTNGLPSTAFSSQNLNFTNINGYAASYSVWYSNTVQNSPIALFQIN